jgi:hypothetical protein
MKVYLITSGNLIREVQHLMCFRIPEEKRLAQEAASADIVLK